MAGEVAGIMVGDLGMMRQVSLGSDVIPRRDPSSPWLPFGPYLQHDRKLRCSLPKAQRADPPLRVGSDPSSSSPGWGPCEGIDASAA